MTPKTSCTCPAEAADSAAVSAPVLTPAERTAGTCLPCRAVPTSDTVVRLNEGDRLRRIFPLL